MKIDQSTEKVPGKPSAAGKPREFGPDVVRIGAFCLLLWLHFFLRNNFYHEPNDDVADWIACCFRPVFMCCVPLFIMLTGYLKCGKELKKGYYHSLGPIMCSWVLISLVFLAYKIVYLKEQETVAYWICNFFDFRMANYSWYIEMYFGLFLLSPFLNGMWNQTGRMGETARKNHLILLVSLIFLTFIPSTYNGKASFDGNAFGLFPGYFTGLYFITYYLLGCFLRTYPYKKGALRPLLILMAVAAGLGARNFLTRTDPADYSSGFTCEYNNIYTAILTVLLFMIFISIRTESKTLKRIAAWISPVILEAYLLSWLFDTKIYVMGRGSYGPEQYWWRGLLSTAAVFVLSVAAGKVMHLISGIVYGWFEKIVIRNIGKIFGWVGEHLAGRKLANAENQKNYRK